MLDEGDEDNPVLLGKLATYRVASAIFQLIPRLSFGVIYGNML
jgi:hypothetical protein